MVLWNKYTSFDVRIIAFLTSYLGKGRSQTYRQIISVMFRILVIGIHVLNGIINLFVYIVRVVISK